MHTRRGIGPLPLLEPERVNPVHATHHCCLPSHHHALSSLPLCGACSIEGTVMSDSWRQLSGGPAMTFDDILDQTIEMLQRRGRLTYRTLKR